jgi:predicted porin
MKKHLIAAGVVAAFAAPAMAQNVSVYGNIEMGPSITDTGSASTTTIANGVVNSSRLGFKGSEDLGGGLKAFFRLESGLNPETGSLGGSKTDSSNAGGSQTTVTTSSANFFNRGAEIGLSGAFGSVKLGKFDMPNEGVEISHFGNVGLAATSGIFENDIEIGSDVSGAYAYTTPAINGLKFTVAGTFSDQTDGTGVGASVGEYTSYGVEGSFGGVTFKAATGTQAGTSTGDVKQNALSASTAIGGTNVSGTYISNDGGTGVYKRLSILTASTPLGAGLTAHGMVRNYKVEAQVKKQTGYALGVSKAFSKRTTGYAAYMAANATTASSGATISDANKPNVWYIGVNHSF